MAVENSAILLTAPGVAALAVVRLCGPKTGEFLQRRFSRPVAVGRCVHGELRDNGGAVLDDPVVVLVDAETADLNLHGGTYVVRAVLQLCRADGFVVHDRIESPLPPEALDGGDAFEIEMLQYLPLARTELAVRALLAQPAAWRGLQERIETGKATTTELRAILDDQSLRWLLALPRVAIVGPANVGKSTLANRLFNQERSITADLPGTTRDWVGEVANINGLAVMLIDTPGQRAAKATVDPIERAALGAAQPQIAAADLVVVVLDASAPIPAEGAALLAAHPSAIVLANKSDRPAAWDFSAAAAIPTVATTGENLDAVTAAILDRFGCNHFQMDLPRCWTQRQRRLVQAALDANSPA